MKKLRVFNTQVEYDYVKCDLEKTVVKVRENKSVNLKKESYITAIFNVKSITSPTTILGYITNRDTYLGSGSTITKMYIDDIEVIPTSAYTFSTTGEHSIKYMFCDVTTCEGMFTNVTDIISVDLSNSYNILEKKAKGKKERKKKKNNNKEV